MPQETKHYEKHYEDSIFIPAPAQDVFDYVDNHSDFYSHVIKFSRMAGGTMDLQMDQGRGHAVGSHIRLAGKVLGQSLSLEEVITRREPPRVKTWETVGFPNFLIVGQYQMEVQVEPQDNGSLLRVYFGSNPPAKGGWLRRQFSSVYGKLCAGEMVKVTRDYFTRRRQR